jgi:hypothetical protein
MLVSDRSFSARDLYEHIPVRYSLPPYRPGDLPGTDTSSGPERVRLPLLRGKAPANAIARIRLNQPCSSWRFTKSTITEFTSRGCSR